MTTHKPPNLPKYSDLPYTKGDPRKSAWGLYGKDDELGFLNRQTDEIVAAAAKSEIKTGVRYDRVFAPYHTLWSLRRSLL